MSTSQTNLSLDHVALVVSDLDRASDTYARMGFNLSARSSHKGRLRPEGPVELWGTGNHCAMFSEGYFEILGITDRNLKCDHVRDLLDKYEGLHLIALGCTDAAAEADKLRQRLGRGESPYLMSRDVPMPGGGTNQATFNLLHLPVDTFPEADLFLIEHRNRDVIWHHEMLTQANGVVGLSEVVVCSDAVQDTAQRLSAVLGVTANIASDSLSFELAHGRISLVTPARLESEFSQTQPPKLPWVAAVMFDVSDLHETQRFLQQHNFNTNTRDEYSIWIDAADAAGTIVVFTARG